LWREADATHRVDHAAIFDEKPVAGALDDAAFVNGDRRVDQVASQRPQSSERAILVSRGETAKSTTSAARIAAIFRFSLMARPHPPFR
jgi:hypothetical protein